MAARRTPTTTSGGSNTALEHALVQRDRHPVGARSGSEFGTDRPLSGAVTAAVFGGNMQSTWQFLRAKSHRLRGTSRGMQCAIGTPEMKTRLEFDLNGVRMSPCATDASGVVSSATVMIFEQTNDVVSARYRGGSIADGYLIGHLHGRSIHFRYVQAQSDGRLDAGVSNGQIERLPDGRLRLIEHFEWQTRSGGGINVFEEAPSLHEPTGEYHVCKQ